MNEIRMEATQTCTQIPPDAGTTPSLSKFLTHVHGKTGTSVQGLAFATNGTWTVLGFDRESSVKASKLLVSLIDGRDFDPTKIFELRLWIPAKLPDKPAEGDVLAHEYRWVNGVGAVELTLTADTSEAATEGTESASVSGWAHKVSYLLHKSAATSKEESAPDTSTRQTQQEKQDTATNEMSAVEFIHEEDKYGNTVVVDQLFTGEWGR